MEDTLHACRLGAKKLRQTEPAPRRRMVTPKRVNSCAVERVICHTPWRGVGGSGDSCSRRKIRVRNCEQTVRKCEWVGINEKIDQVKVISLGGS